MNVNSDGNGKTPARVASFAAARHAHTTGRRDVNLLPRHCRISGGWRIIDISWYGREESRVKLITAGESEQRERGEARRRQEPRGRGVGALVHGRQH